MDGSFKRSEIIKALRRIDDNILDEMYAIVNKNDLRPFVDHMHTLGMVDIDSFIEGLSKIEHCDQSVSNIRNAELKPNDFSLLNKFNLLSFLLEQDIILSLDVFDYIFFVNDSFDCIVLDSSFIMNSTYNDLSEFLMNSFKGIIPMSFSSKAGPQGGAFGLIL